MDPLTKRLESLGQRIKEQECRDKAENMPAGQVVQLPLWPEPVRGAPNAILRSALFAAIQGKGRRFVKGELLAALQGVQIRFTGEQLDQSDLDVWEQAIHFARHHPLGNVCYFSTHGFLKALGRCTGKKDHNWLHKVFLRLTACAVEITQNGKTYFGSLIEEGARDEATGRYRLRLNPNLVSLYGPGMWTAAEWQQRQILRRKPLSLWLHGFLASHTEPYPLKIETIMQLSGSRNTAKRSFLQKLKVALNDLVNVGSVTDFEIKRDLVSIQKSPATTQQ